MKQGTLSGCLFANAEMAKDMVEQVIGGDGAGEASQVVKGGADILGQEVSGNLLSDALTNTGK